MTGTVNETEQRLWIERQGVTCSPLGRKVHEALWHTFRGIYHRQGAVTHKRVKWDDDRWIEVVIYGELATFDYDELSRLVIICHDLALRVSIKGAAHGYLRLEFHPREREGGVWKRHPTMEQAIETSRKDR